MKYFYQFSLLVAPYFLFGQKIDLKWSEEFKRREQVEIIGVNNGNIYGYYVNNDKEIVLKMFNSDAISIKEQVVNLPLSTKKYKILKCFILNNLFHLFLIESIRKEDKLSLILVKIDLNFKADKNAFILDEAPDRLSTKEPFIINLSPDSNKCFIYNSEMNKRNTHEEYSIKVFNSQFTTVEWEKKVQMPYKDEDYTIEKFAVDNFGNVYCLAKIEIPSKERERGEDDYKYALNTFQNKTGKSTELAINFDKSHITSAQIFPGEKNTLICTGFYDSLKKLNGIFHGIYEDDVSDGFFSIIIDCKSLAIGSKFNNKIDGLYPIKKKGQDRIPYIVKKLYNTGNSGYILLAEQYQLIELEFNHGKEKTKSSYYFYCDMVAIEIDEKSAVKSVTRVPKYQVNSIQPSISSCYNDNKLFIFYIDLVENLENFEDKDISHQQSGWLTKKKTCLTMAKIDFKGKPKKEMIFSCNDLDIYPNIKSAINVNNNSLIFKTLNQIGILTIN
ncbi:MAG: hypothetical protein ABI851_12450 [Saprospiraceae bacterium]